MTKVIPSLSNDVWSFDKQENVQIVSHAAAASSAADLKAAPIPPGLFIGVMGRR